MSKRRNNVVFGYEKNFQFTSFQNKSRNCQRIPFSTKKPSENGQIGAHGLNCKILINVKLIFEINDKNYTR